MHISQNMKQLKKVIFSYKFLSADVRQGTSKGTKKVRMQGKVSYRNPSAYKSYLSVSSFWNFASESQEKLLLVV